MVLEYNQEKHRPTRGLFQFIPTTFGEEQKTENKQAPYPYTPCDYIDIFPSLTKKGGGVQYDS